MDIKITFPGNLQVNAEYGPHTMVTNQDGSAPAPFALFLASIGTCAGIYVLSFCKQRGLDTTGLAITQQMQSDPATRRITHISLTLHLPSSFPEKYREAVIRAADQCTVKKHLQHPPELIITTQPSN